MDTGVVFMRRDDFIHTGGYPENRHYAEDIAFLVKLIRLGRSRGQRMIRLRAFKSIASTRKFDRYGDWHYFWLMPALTIGTLVPKFSGSERARAYWYGDR
jgi:hypothetical protein